MSEECPICLSPLDGSITVVGCCKKQFHTGCILKCTQQKNECPMCRKDQCIIQIPEMPQVEAPSRNTVLRYAIYSFVSIMIGIILVRHVVAS